MERQQFDQLRFPYPLAQVYSYLPTPTERGINKVGGVTEACQRAVICFETFCRFCVWEMVMEYARLERRDDSLTKDLADSLFFPVQGVSTGTWVRLLGELSGYLKSYRDELFISEMPFLYCDAKRKGISALAREVVSSFPSDRNVAIGHVNTCRSPESQLEYYHSMRDKLLAIYNGLGFLERYCLISVGKAEKNIVQEAYLLDGFGRADFEAHTSEIRFLTDHAFLPDTTLFIRREALYGGGDNPFLLYPIFLFDVFRCTQSAEVPSPLCQPPDEIYILNSIKHNHRLIKSLMFSGHRQTAAPSFILSRQRIRKQPD